MDMGVFFIPGREKKNPLSYFGQTPEYRVIRYCLYLLSMYKDTHKNIVRPVETEAYYQDL